MNVTKYVKSLRSERTALYGRLHVVERELDEISSALSEDAPAATEPRVARHAATLKRKRAVQVLHSDVRERVIAALKAHQPTTRLALDEIIRHESRPVLKGMVRDGSIVCRAWKLADHHGKPPYYYALSTPVLDRMEQELIDSGQWSRQSAVVHTSVTTTGDHHARI